VHPNYAIVMVALANCNGGCEVVGAAVVGAASAEYVITKIEESFLSEKPFSLQKVCNTKILHLAASIFFKIT
jgi:hypothetical protein